MGGKEQRSIFFYCTLRLFAMVFLWSKNLKQRVNIQDTSRKHDTYKYQVMVFSRLSLTHLWYLIQVVLKRKVRQIINLVYLMGLSFFFYSMPLMNDI